MESTFTIIDHQIAEEPNDVVDTYVKMSDILTLMDKLKGYYDKTQNLMGIKVCNECILRIETAEHIQGCHCNECKYSFYVREDSCSYCGYNDIRPVMDDGFCSEGVRNPSQF